MAVPSGYDIGLDSTDPADALPVRGFMLVDHRQQDITPSSARRSDGDTRFQLIPSESFWSQQDVAGGYGRSWPADPTMYWYGPADTLGGARILSAWHTEFPGGANGFFGVSGNQLKGLVGGPNDRFYQVVQSSGLVWDSAHATADGDLTFDLDPGSTAAVTDAALFRGYLYVAHGSAGNVYVVDSAGSVGAVAPAFTARLLCPYLSMLFHMRYDASTRTWRLNRYDPENTAAVPDLAVLPVNDGSVDYVRSLVVLGPDLFIVCRDALYKFTSQNGNSGVLAGPIDRWTPTGRGAREIAGYAAAAYQGALVYSTGGTLRRHQPGGGSRTIWPVSPNQNAPAIGQDDLGQQRLIGALVPYDDRLFAVAVDAGLSEGAASATHNLYLYCWTGAGMHWLATGVATFTAPVPGSRPLAAIDGYGNLMAGPTVAGTNSGSGRMVVWRVGPSATRKYVASTVVRTSILDFSMLDLDKVVARVGVACTLPSAATYSVAVSLFVLDQSAAVPSWVEYPLATRTGNYSEVAGAYKIVYFSRAATPFWLVGQLFYIQVTITGPAAASSSAEIAAITCVPNPVYPVRYGFQVTIPIGTHVMLHSGGAAYPDQAAVNTALAYCRTLRGSSYPFTLDWIDGASYTVRCNTISIVRDKMRPNDSAWLVRLDLQQVTGA